MSQPKVGDEFVTHEFDEAIAIQRTIVQAEEALVTSHPVAAAKRTIKAALTEDRRFLGDLERMGREYDATGKVEDVAGGLSKLMTETLATATKDGADSDVYEAHAVLLNLKRKQMDSAGGMRKIATAIKDKELRAAAVEFERAQRTSSKSLAADLADYAREIAVAPTS